MAISYYNLHSSLLIFNVITLFSNQNLFMLSCNFPYLRVVDILMHDSPFLKTQSAISHFLFMHCKTTFPLSLISDSRHVIYNLMSGWWYLHYCVKICWCRWTWLN